MGGSGGGGNSGKIDYPAYIKDCHADWLYHGAPDGEGTDDDIIQSMCDTMNAAFGNSPFTGANAYSPDADITAFLAEVTNFKSMDFSTLLGTYTNRLIEVGSLPVNPRVDWLSHVIEAKTGLDANLFSDAEVEAEIEAFSDQLDAQIEETVLPRFQRGMQDINAVLSSAFVVGQALIEEGRTRDVAKFSADLRLQNYKAETAAVLAIAADILNKRAQMLETDNEYAYKCAVAEYEMQKAITASTIEARRIKIVAKKEEAEHNLTIDEADAKWDLEVFQYGANLLAAGPGGTVTNVPKPNKAASAIGGALSGAGMGAMIGGSAAFEGMTIGGVGAGPVGAVAGGLLGGLASLFN